MTVTILGQELEAVTLDEAVDQIVALVGRGGIIVTMNVDHAVLLERHSGLQEAYRRARHRYADGMPILWLAWWLRTPLPARVTGADLLPAVLTRAELQGLSVHLVGGSEATGMAARKRAAAMHPQLRWTGQVSPPFGFEKSPELDAAVVAGVAACDPDIVLVCLGAPKQEEWAVRHAASMPRAALLCIGAAVDFYAGTAARAPLWVRRAGFEWVFRLLQEPGRLWRRYLVQDARFLVLALTELRRRRRDDRPVDAA